MILKSSHWPRRRCHLKISFIFSSGRHFILLSEMILAIWVTHHKRNISVKLFWNQAIGQAREEISFKGFCIFSSGNHFVQQSWTILANLVEGHPRNMPVKLFQNPFTSFGGDVISVNCWQTPDVGQQHTTDIHCNDITIAHYQHFVLKWAKNSHNLKLPMFCSFHVRILISPTPQRQQTNQRPISGCC